MGYWYPVLGGGIFWIGLIVSIILFAVKRKWYPIMYLISIALYIFTLGFAIDVFDVSNNVIMLLLAFSAFLMILLGVYLSAVSHKESKKEQDE
jgi:UDP-N-acetylmuramyl pentapeptide phosphotransferase/UDP-N-acetylglucosamine-1-phosphate transferase